MPYSTKQIKVDFDGKPIPQYFDPDADDFGDLRGEDGAGRVLLWDASGSKPLLTADNKGHVRATEIEDRLTAIEGKIDTILDGSTPASVQLTGSIVTYQTDEEIVNGSSPVSVTAGSSVDLVARRARDALCVAISLNLSSNVADDFRVAVWQYAQNSETSATIMLVEELTNRDTNGTVARFSTPFSEITAPYYKVRVSNDAQSDYSIRAAWLAKR